MRALQSFARRYPIMAYFSLTFGISWGGVLILAAPYGIPAPQATFEAQWPVVFIPYFLGPSSASLLMIGLVYGKTGYRELFARLIKWRVPVRWYAVALLMLPLLVTAILLTLSLISPVYLPAIVTADNKISVMVTGLLVGIVAGGLLEDLGWTGFATPEVRRRYGVLTTGLIVGFLWGLWHFVPTFWGSGDASGAISLARLLPPCFFYAAVLPACRVLIVWVYDRTESLLLAMLMHASLSACTIFILLPAALGMELFVYYLILVVVLWVLVGVTFVRREITVNRLKIQNAYLKGNN